MMTRTSEPAGWIRLTLRTNGEPLYIRADMIRVIFSERNAEQVVYSVIDTGRDQWVVREPVNEVMQRVLMEMLP